jgi:hypothetical protein
MQRGAFERKHQASRPYPPALRQHPLFCCFLRRGERGVGERPHPAEGTKNLLLGRVSQLDTRRALRSRSRSRLCIIRGALEPGKSIVFDVVFDIAARTLGTSCYR